MLFLNMWLLLGVLGIAIPVIIHLLNRRHAKIIDWGAMRFLLDSLISRRRRVLLEEILLLAARCLLVGLAALALARPFIHESSRVPWGVVLPAALLAVVLFGVSFALWRYPAWRRRVLAAAALLVLLCAGAVFGERWLNLKRFGGGGARDVALVLDGSSSMTMTLDGESNFARAVKEAQTYVDAAPAGYSFSLIIGGSVPNVLAPAPTPDRKRLRDLLLAAQPVQGTMVALDTLAVAATTLSRGDHANKQIVMIGDGQSVGWQVGQSERWAHLQEVFGKLPSSPRVIWRKLSMPRTIRNAAISGIALSRDVVGTDREVRIDVTVANTGGESITPQRVELTVGTDVLVDRSLGRLSPGMSATATFLYRFQRTGTEGIKARVVANDELSGDDEALHVVCVIENLKMLVVDAAEGLNYLDRPGSFLALALKPSVEALTSGKGQKDFLVDPELVSLPNFIARGGAGDARVVALVDVPRLPPEAAASLANFVEQGGGLLVVAGGGVDRSFYNEWRGYGGPVMPLALKERVEPAETNRPSLSTRSFSHRALASLERADLGTVALKRYWTSEAVETEDVRIGARFADGTPYLAERRYGRGFVLQVNAPMDATAGNLVGRQAFVPLAHELIYHLARPVVPALNLPPSRGATLQLAVSAQGQAGGGLRAEYHSRDQQTGNPVVRVDPGISSTLAWPGPRPQAQNGYMVIWTGSIAVPETGAYTLERGEADGDYDITINSRNIMKGGKKRAEIDLTKGERYDLRVVYICPRNARSLALAPLTLAGPGLPAQAIPAAFLSPEKAGADRRAGEGIAAAVRGPGRTLAGRYVTDRRGALGLRIDENLVPGLYAAAVPRELEKAAAPLRSESGDILFGVLVSGDESRLAPLSTEDLAFIAGYLQFQAAASAEDVMRAMRGQALGREVWRLLFLGFLALLSLEILLTRWIAIQRRAGDEGAVTFEEANLPSAGFREQLAKISGNRG